MSAVLFLHSLFSLLISPSYFVFDLEKYKWIIYMFIFIIYNRVNNCSRLCQRRDQLIFQLHSLQNVSNKCLRFHSLSGTGNRQLTRRGQTTEQQLNQQSRQLARSLCFLSTKEKQAAKCAQMTRRARPNYNRLCVPAWPTLWTNLANQLATLLLFTLIRGW